MNNHLCDIFLRRGIVEHICSKRGGRMDVAALVAKMTKCILLMTARLNVVPVTIKNLLKWGHL